MTIVRQVPSGRHARSTMTPSSYVTAEAFRSGSPEEKAATHLTSPDERFTVGLWSAEPYTEDVTDHDGYEYTLVLEGRVTLTDEDGTVHSFVPGQSFTIEPGWSGEYRVEESLLKQFAFYTPGKES